jgi:peptide-methionine (S)-S-oxide reductase
VGTQYRSEYFITTRSRKDKRYIDLMTAEDTFGKRIVTKISPVSFYEAEEVHHQIIIMIINRLLLFLCYYSKIDKLKKCLKINLKIMEKETMVIAKVLKKRIYFVYFV